VETLSRGFFADQYPKSPAPTGSCDPLPAIRNDNFLCTGGVGVFIIHS
jgi:hypothetical protein